MKKACILIAAGLILASTTAQAKTELGIRGGWADASGDVFHGSGDVGSAGIYGLVAAIGLFANIDVEFAYERYTSDFSFEDAVTESGEVFSGDGEYNDDAYLMTGKLNLPLLAAPFGPYVGGGFSLHELDLDISSAETGIDDQIRQIEGQSSEWSWHLVAGLGLKIPVLPLRAYAEYRYQNIQDDNSPRYSSVYAGLNLYLQ